MGRFGWITRKFVIFRLFKKCESAYFSKQMCYGVRSTSVVHVLRTCYTPKIRNGRYINPIGVIWLNIAWGYVRKGLGIFSGYQSRNVCWLPQSTLTTARTTERATGSYSTWYGTCYRRATARLGTSLKPRISSNTNSLRGLQPILHM